MIDAEIVSNYRACRSSFLRGDIGIAERYYRDNRRLGIDLYYEVALPEHLLLVHPVGTVLGRAAYGDYLVAYQNVGVGSDVDSNRPVIGSGVVLFPGARVLGKTVIGDNVWITANTVVQGVTVPSNSIVFAAPFMHKRSRVVQSDHDGEDMMIADNYIGVTCGWRSTERSVVDRYFGASPPHNTGET